MKKIILIVAGLFAMGAPVLFAQTNKPAESSTAQPAQAVNREELREKLKGMTPEQRKEYFQQHPEVMAQGQPQRIDFVKNLGLDPEELRALPREERQAKLKEAMAKKTEELSKKKAAGTLTPEEQQMFSRLEMMQKMSNRPARAPHAAVPPAAVPPAGAQPTEEKK